VGRDKAKTTRKREDRDVVLRISVFLMLLMLMIGSLVVTAGMMNPREDPTEGLKRLKEMEGLDVKAIDGQIQVLEEEERAADEAWANRAIGEKFANSFVIGDSITQGLYEHGVLEKARVTAEGNSGVCDTEETRIEGHIEKAVETAPQVLFLSYGINDIVASTGHVSVFTDAYRDVLDRLKEELPDTKICVNSILPVQQSVIDKNPLYGNISKYNQELEELCGELDVLFIDNGSLVEDEYYTEDGIHMGSGYYEKWADHMAEEAEL
jgi:lysophospholipase L1-like esterase